MRKKRIIALILSATIALGLAGCGGNGASKKTVKIDPDASYPLQTDETLSVFMALGTASVRYATADDVPFFQELQRLTGVDLEFIHPPAGQGAERLKIMLASGDVCDIIVSGWTDYTGGAEAAIDEGHVAPLNDLMETHAKDFKAVVEAYPEVAKAAKTDKGDYYTFPQIREDEYMNVCYGPVMRMDWLESLGLEAPQTLDEWYETLKAFKEKKGASVPLMMSYQTMVTSGAFFGANGVAPAFYRDGNTVKYGPLEKGYKETVMFVKKLYDEGLITDCITGFTGNERDSLVLNGECGATIAWLNSNVRSWNSNKTVKGTGFNFEGVKYPSKNKGEDAVWSHSMNPFVPYASIGAGSNKKELAAKVLNFLYTPEGQTLANYGIEGTTYELIDGKPKYTDFVFNNPEELSLSEVLGIYAFSSDSGPYLYKLDAFKQINDEPALTNSIQNWVKTGNAEHKLPMITIATEDLDEYSTLLADIDTYNAEMFYKFVLGTESMDKYDAYVAQLKKMGAEKLVAIQQKAYDRYLSR